MENQSKLTVECVFLEILRTETSRRTRGEFKVRKVVFLICFKTEDSDSPRIEMMIDDCNAVLLGLQLFAQLNLPIFQYVTLSVPHIGLYSAVATHGQLVVDDCVVLLGALLELSEIPFDRSICGNARATIQIAAKISATVGRETIAV